MWKILKDHWEQYLFRIAGLAFLAFSFYNLARQDLTGASATFAMGFLCFIFSNIARFKRFKGLGIEAELWEDKQKEAEQLINRLKSVVYVYTREAVMQKVMRGRFSNGANWQENWDLYEELVQEHRELGQEIDFSNLKAEVDSVFLFDFVTNQYEPIRAAVSKSRTQAQRMIQEEFGKPITDAEGYKNRCSQLREIPADLRDLFEMSAKGDVARDVLNWAAEAEAKLKEHFGLEIDLPNKNMSKLKSISELYQKGPIAITEKLIRWADGNDPGQ